MTIDVPTLSKLLQPLKEQGMGPGEAVRLALASASASTASGVGARAFSLPQQELVQNGAVVAEAVHNVFSPITAAALAIILHETYPNLTALEIGGIILAPNVLPGTPAPEMASALAGAGFDANSTNDAVNVLYPITLTVQANQAWQASGLNVTGRQVTLISAQGSWTANPANGMVGPAGDSRFIAPARYTLPGAPEAALIGKIGSNAPFLVGAYVQAPPGQSGPLQLCINDDLDGVYGAGLRDNVGTLQVNLQTKGN
ncbi:hypothetical protein [Pseudomonas piscis]|uniref:hypothetical protein n=1 Tax=Pseudomonas piscis TaxID=2614538 RepID=UPI0021D5B5A9|nr:hypothetical protein [Pseudomonas piscis]MCU7646536.1 hypothetical protein [Pseudomonas piscis]